MNGESDNEFFCGKYQGVVTDNQDPMHLGRIKAKVPDVYGDDESGWALPCAPFSGFCALPKVNAGVWIEFIGGDPDYPVWSGCWWGSPADMPSVLLPAPDKKVVLETEGGSRITFDDTPGSGGITMETSGGQKIKLTATGIEIDNGNGATIKLSGPSVKINDQALEVT
ncbi:MAG: phage baseplate assembly protein V [Bacteroidota bacterium]